MAFAKAKAAQGIVWKFHPQNALAMDWDRRLCILPCKYKDQVQWAYWLRVFMDHIALRNSILPLHCAVVRKDDNTIFIFAPAGGGKSAITLELGCIPGTGMTVCDDHCLIAENHIQGNSFCRIRTFGQETYLPALGNADFIPRKTIAVQISSGPEKIEKMSLSAFANSNFFQGASKYIEEEPIMYPANLDKLFGIELRSVNRPRVARFLSSLAGLYHLRGNIEFIANVIRELQA